MSTIRPDLNEFTRDFNDFAIRIQIMNEVFEIGNNTQFTNLGLRRLVQFHSIIFDELQELTDLVQIGRNRPRDEGYSLHETIDPRLTLNEQVMFADWLADMIIYLFSEARRWGLPLQEILHTVMDSQDSKLVDSKSIKDPVTNKFLKGPNYQPPEPHLRQLFLDLHD